jgi:eukaryotic-like serine/threonine-protein kinase
VPKKQGAGEPLVRAIASLVVWSGPVNDWPKLDGLRIESRLDAEGVTESYAAVQESLDRRVIVKSLKPNILPSSPFASALGREAQLLSQLSHPNIQQLYDFRRTDSQMWLVLEHLEGQPLESLLKGRTRLPPLAVASIGFMVASALAHCHQHGVVHRAIEPKNVVLVGDGRTVLVNFVGAVKDRLPTAPELLDGSAHLSISPYFSPEQVLGETVDPRSDIFSLGAVLYHALTGQNPFASPDESRVSQRIRKDIVPPASRFARDVPGALERVLHRCLEKMPQDRFTSANELCHAFESLLRDHELVSPEAECRRLIVPPAGPAANQDSLRDPKPRVTSDVTTRPITSGLVGLGLGVALLAAGGGVLHRTRGSENDAALHNPGRLEFSPDHAGTLRIVADPWATVEIDGQSVGTTPMARPIPLPAGIHYVHLEHPRAPIERRTVRLSAGETVLLDVKMNVAPSPDPVSSSGATSSDAGLSP